MTQFMIRPSYESTAASATYVVLLFSMYVLFVGYMASYDLAYVPNTGMLGDLLFGNNEQYEKFKLFVKQVTRDGFTPTREAGPEAGPEAARTSWFEDAAQHLQAYWYTSRGHTVKVRSNA